MRRHKPCSCTLSALSVNRLQRRRSPEGDGESDGMDLLDVPLRSLWPALPAYSSRGCCLEYGCPCLVRFMKRFEDQKSRDAITTSVSDERQTDRARRVSASGSSGNIPAAIIEAHGQQYVIVRQDGNPSMLNFVRITSGKRSWSGGELRKGKTECKTH